MKHALIALTAALALAGCGAGTGGGPTAAGSPAGSPPTPAGAAPSPATSPASGPAATGPVMVVKEVNASGRGGAFDPPTLKVPVGTTVKWTNASGNIHNVTFDDKSIQSSGVMSNGDSHQVTFTKAGTYKYNCTYHPGMDGEITVG